MNKPGWTRRRRVASSSSKGPATSTTSNERIAPEDKGDLPPATSGQAPDAFVFESRAAEDAAALIDDTSARATSQDPAAIAPGPPLDRRAPFVIGLLAVLGGSVGYGIALLVVQLATIILYVAVALFLALGVESVVGWLVRLGLSRVHAVLLVLAGFLVAFGLLAWLAVPPISDQISVLVDRAPSYIDEVRHTPWVERVNDRWHLTDRLLQDVQNGIGAGTVTTVFGGLFGAGKAFADGVLATFTVIVLTIYFVIAMPRVKAAAYVLVPRSRRPRVVYLSEQIARRVGRYLFGQFCVATINGLFAYVILLVLGLPYPTLLAVLVGLLAVVPILGTLLGGTIMTLVALTAGWVPAVVVIVYYVVYHLFETYVISPRVMSRAVEIPPVITIVAVLAGGALLGVVGALMAIPVASGLAVLYHQVVVPRQQRT